MSSAVQIDVSVLDNPNDKDMAAILRADSRPERNAILLERDVRDFGSGVIDKRCFTDRAYHEAEKKRLWPTVWQLACLEEEIPNVGDFHEYVIIDQSILVVRTAGMEIKAYFNACRHRGMRLKCGSGRARELRCPFHGWTWALDGALRDVPCSWDFPEVRRETHALAECRVQTWNGLVYINMDPDASPLEDFLGATVMRHFGQWDRAHRWKSLHIAKVFKCNWKLALLAFIESYHVLQTHSEWAPFAGDGATQYDAYGLHSRLITPLAVQSPHMGLSLSEQEVIDSMRAEMFADLFSAERSSAVPLAENETARRTMAAYRRKVLAEQTGLEFDRHSDSEMVDLIEYTIFPNVALFGGELAPILYRVRPNGDDHESSLFEMMVFSPIPANTARPPAAPVRMVTEDETWFDVPEVASVARNLTQDTSNLEQIQLAQHSLGYPGPTYARYQEMGLRQFHKNLDEWLGSN
jgi:phenylpropionate dioxygenase-like ring-hydroxylating dioxygenase large terminal subunit